MATFNVFQAGYIGTNLFYTEKSINNGANFTRQPIQAVDGSTYAIWSLLLNSNWSFDATTDTRMADTSNYTGNYDPEKVPITPSNVESKMSDGSTIALNDGDLTYSHTNLNSFEVAYVTLVLSEDDGNGSLGSTTFNLGKAAILATADVTTQTVSGTVDVTISNGDIATFTY